MIKKLRKWRQRKATKSVATNVETHDVNTDGNNDPEGAPNNSFGHETTNLLVDSECQTDPLNYLEMNTAEVGKTKILHQSCEVQGNSKDFANNDQFCLTSSRGVEANAATELQCHKLSELDTGFNKGNATFNQKTTCLNVLVPGVFESMNFCINNRGRRTEVKLVDINPTSNRNPMMEVTEGENTLQNEKEAKREVLCPQDNAKNSDEVVLYDLPTNYMKGLKESCAIDVQALVHGNNNTQNDVLDTSGQNVASMTESQDDADDDDYDDSYGLHNLTLETSSEDDSSTYGGSIVTVRHKYSIQDIKNKANDIDSHDIHDKITAYEHHSLAKPGTTYNDYNDDDYYEEMMSHKPFNMKTNFKNEEADDYEVVGSNQNEHQTYKSMVGTDATLVSSDSVRKHIYEKIDYSKISFGNKERNLGATVKKVVACSNSSSEEEEEEETIKNTPRCSQKSFTRDATVRRSYKGACKYFVYDYGHF